jgi:hypothetical protein
MDTTSPGDGKTHPTLVSAEVTRHYLDRPNREVARKASLSLALHELFPGRREGMQARQLFWSAYISSKPPVFKPEIAALAVYDWLNERSVARGALIERAHKGDVSQADLLFELEHLHARILASRDAFIAAGRGRIDKILTQRGVAVAR